MNLDIRDAPVFVSFLARQLRAHGRIVLTATGVSIVTLDDHFFELDDGGSISGPYPSIAAVLRHRAKPLGELPGGIVVEWRPYAVFGATVDDDYFGPGEAVSHLAQEWGRMVWQHLVYVDSPGGSGGSYGFELMGGYVAWMDEAERFSFAPTLLGALGPEELFVIEGSRVDSPVLSAGELASLLRLWNDSDGRREVTVPLNGEPTVFVAEGRQVVD